MDFEILLVMGTYETFMSFWDVNRFFGFGGMRGKSGRVRGSRGSD